MTIKIVTVTKSSVFTPLNHHDTRTWDHLPPALTDKMLHMVSLGFVPATRQPEDSVVIDEDGNHIVTTVWNDAVAAQNWIDQTALFNTSDVISRTLVID